MDTTETTFDETTEAAQERRSIAVVRPHVMEAMAIIMSTESTRYYLNGIFIQPHQNGGIVLVATDGHLMVVLRDTFGYAAGAPQIWRWREFAGVVKAKLQNVAKGLRSSAQLRYENMGPGDGKHDFQVALAFGHPQDEVPTMAWGSSMCEAIGSDAAIDGTFPEYTRVIPSIGETRSGATFGSDLLSRIGKFAETLTLRKSAPVVFEITDTKGPSVFHVDSIGEGVDAIGVIMPRSDGVRLLYHPTWLAEHVGRPYLGAPAPLEIDTSSPEDGDGTRVAEAA